MSEEERAGVASTEAESPAQSPEVSAAVAEKVKIPYKGNKVPLVLLLVWVTFFAWMLTYVILYLVPALPE